jgi:DNA-binding NtrC family response regulator
MTPKTKRLAVAPLRVLLTDDTMSVLKITGQMLKRAGHVVDVAENGSQSLNLLKQRYDSAECFELLLTDLQMPGTQQHSAVQCSAVSRSLFILSLNLYPFHLNSYPRPHP